MPGLASKGKFSYTGGAIGDQRGAGQGAVRCKPTGWQRFPTVRFPLPTGKPAAMADELPTHLAGA